MEAESMRSGGWAGAFAAVDWNAVTTWVLGFGVVAFLGIDGGGYDQLVHSQVGIAVWWVVLLGVLVGALPRLLPTRFALVAIGALLAFTAWSALSAIWTESAERTWADVSLVLTYLGLFVLILMVKAPREPQRLVAAVGSAIALIAIVGLLSRLHPAWFSNADQTAQFLSDSRERLSYPLNYWNGLGALIAVGLPLLLHIACTARALVFRALAAAALPALALALIYTLSRGGIVAAAIAVALLLALSSDRVPKLVATLVAGAGAAILIGLAVHWHELREGLNSATAHHQGDHMLVVVIVVCAAVGLIQAALSATLFGSRRPRWTRPSRTQSRAMVGVCVAVLVVGAIAVDAPRHISHGVDEFKSGENAGAGTARLNSLDGESRYALWRSAVAENATAPVIGTGSGTFEFWWDRDEGGAEVVRDAHSLYLQTLGELGIVGLALLLACLLTIVGAGASAIARGDPAHRSVLAAALSGVLAFLLSAAVDWTWQIPVLPVAMLFLGSTLVMAGGSSREIAGRLRGIPLRLGFAVAALVAIVAIAIPFAAEDLVRESKAAARDGDLAGALGAARTAADVQPYAATPRLQEALVLELQRDYPAAAVAAKAATKRESTNWRTWLVLSRVEAERGNAAASVAAYRKARSLDPLSPLFNR
jgi:hypothetical protein